MSVIIGLLVTYIVAAVNNIAKIFANENQSTITNVMAFGVVFAVIGATVFFNITAPTSEKQRR